MKWSIERKKILFFTLLTLLGAAVVEGTGLAKPRQSRPPLVRDRFPVQDAFLSKPVGSTDELIAVLQKDKKLRQLYAKHFNIAEDRVVDFFKNSLIVYRLPSDRVVTNYCVSKTGRIYSLKQTFPKGTRVWATRSGLPVLRWACANPLTKKLPVPISTIRPKVTRAPKVLNAKPRTIAANTPNPRPKEVIPLPKTIVPETFERETSALVTAAPLSGIGSAVAGGISVPGSRLPWIPFAPLAIPLASSLRGGSNITPGNTPDIPEPGTLALVALGAGPLLLPFARRRHSTRSAA